MDPKFQTSFIPKNPVVTQSKIPSITIPTVNIFSAISTAIFFLTLILIGGLFGYKILLNKQIAQADKDIVQAKQAYQLEAVQSIIDANSRIISTKELLNKHIAVSELFNLLQTLTLKKISFGNFIYTNKEGSYSITMDAEAQTYNALAQQNDIFLKNSFIKDPQFSNFELAENGNIKVKFTTSIDPSLISYKRAIEALSSN